MARKGNQQKNGLDRNLSKQKKGVSDSLSSLPNAKQKGKVSDAKVGSGEELRNGKLSDTEHLREHSSKTDQADEKRSKQKFEKHLKSKKQGLSEGQGLDHPMISGHMSQDTFRSMSTAEASALREEMGSSPISNIGSHLQSSFGSSLSGLRMEDTIESVEVLYRRLKTLGLSTLKASKEWLEKKKPLFMTVATNALNACDFVRMKFERAYPVVLQWTVHFVNIMLLLAMVWLDCCIRGIDSILRMGTTSFLAVIWFSVLSLVSMVGLTKFLVILAISAFTGIMAGLTIAIMLIALFGTVLLWMYGSFWTTAFFAFSGGMAFAFSHERVALLIATLYSVYCGWFYVGWLGLLFGFNISFISSDALIFFLRNNINERRSPDTPFESAGPGNFAEQRNASSSESGFGPTADRSSGVPSTSGSESDLTPEEEVVRLLNCADHYSALGFSKFGSIDVSILKREYRKKAMMVHPDKNMGNEKAVEAFKKLQNAYEVLLDSVKRKSYDDELKREELLSYFRRFQNAPQQDTGYSFFGSRFARTDADSEDFSGESRRIVCRKCNNFHVWYHTKKLKSKARWCQDCNEFHQAKDGDGWVEQFSQPFLFGLMQKVDAPSAYICADSKIYNATEWYICQGMRCPVNTHKPSFHVNTSVTSKHTSGKGMNNGQRGGGIPSNMEAMTEEEFVEWLQNAVHAGMFDNFAEGNSDSPNARAGSGSKGGATNPGGGGASSTGGKRKKKGKKQW